MGSGRQASGFDIWHKGFTLSLNPYVDASATYDTRPGATTEDEAADVFGQVQFGAGLRLTERLLTVNAGSYAFTRRYSNDAPADQETFSGGERVNLSLGRQEKLLIALDESYERLSDYSPAPRARPPAGAAEADTAEGDRTAWLSQDFNERVLRDVFGLGVSVGRDFSGKTLGSIGCQYGYVNYASTNLFDTAGTEGQLRLGYRVTDKSAFFLQGAYGSDDSDGYEARGRSRAVGVGWTTRTSMKVSFDGVVGYESYESGVLRGSTEKSTGDTLGADLVGNWRPTERLSVSVGGHRGIEAAAREANTREVTFFETVLGYELRQDLSCSLGLSYRTDRYDRPAPGAETARQSTGEGAKLTLSYAPYQHASFYVATSYETTESNLPNEDGDQARVTVGSRIAF